MKKTVFVLCFFVLAAALTACGGASTAQVAPADTAVPATEAPTEPAEVVEAEVATEPGDPERGHDIFMNGGTNEAYDSERVCIRCHSLDGSDGGGPTLQGIAERAANRVPGLSAEEYLRQSIMDPTAYLIDGYTFKMGRIFGVVLSEQEINDLVAFLLTQTPPETGPVPDISAYFQADYSGGDRVAGEQIAIDHNCRDCHASVQHPGVRGPLFTASDDMPDILVRGELRMADPAYTGQATTNQEYIVESILLADAYQVPGDWKVPMQTFHGVLTEQDLADILAWLETFSEMDDSQTNSSESQVDQTKGNPQRGQEIFNSGGAHDLYKPEYACATCHTLDGSKSDHGYGGPSLLGIATRAGDRVAGLSAEEYIRQSIVDPAAYVTERYGSKMSNVAIQWLTDGEIDDLVAFLLTQESTEDIAPPPQGNPILGVEVDLDREIAEGDALRGKNAAVKYRCLGCHLEENPEFGVPFTATEDLPNILLRGELRIADPAYKGQATNNLEYILESIFLPDVYILPGKFEEAMPDTYHMRITDQELANIMAWMETFSEAN